MAKEKGTNFLLKVGSADSPTIYTTLQGQKSGELSGSADPIDVSDKTQNGWRSYLPGLKDGTIPVSGIAQWGATPDVLDQLRAAWMADTTVDCHLVINAAGAYFYGNFYVTQWGLSANHDGATEYSVQLSPDGEVGYAASGG